MQLALPLEEETLHPPGAGALLTRPFTSLWVLPQPQSREAEKTGRGRAVAQLTVPDQNPGPSPSMP